MFCTWLLPSPGLEPRMVNSDHRTEKAEVMKPELEASLRKTRHPSGGGSRDLNKRFKFPFHPCNFPDPPLPYSTCCAQVTTPTISCCEVAHYEAPAHAADSNLLALSLPKGRP